MYRLLDKHKEVRERRNQLRHPEYTKPELLAERPNEVWSWAVWTESQPCVFVGFRRDQIPDS